MRRAAMLVPALAVALAAPLLVATPAFAAPTDDIVISEIAQNNQPTDWVELANTGTDTVDISGWRIIDNDDTRAPFVIPAGTTLAPGAFYVADVDVDQNDIGFKGFGLGRADEVRLFDATGAIPSEATLVDSYSWTDHAATSFARCPNLQGDFVLSGGVTRGAANQCGADVAASVRINEIVSNGGSPDDWIELINTASIPADVSGLGVMDSDARDFTIPAGTIIPAGGFLVMQRAELGFGLGDNDQVRLVLNGTTIDQYGWGPHVLPSAGRCPDGAGAFVAQVSATPGAANDCPTLTLPTVVINEVESDDPAGGDDWIELFNTGTAPVDVSGFILRDNQDGNAGVIPAGTVIPAGGYWVATQALFGFGLGQNGEQARLFLPDGVTLVDGTEWGAHAAATWARCPNGVGEFGASLIASPGSANICAGTALINEVESNGDAVGDWVELVNPDTVNSLDVSGWTLIDNDPSHTPLAIPAGTSIESGGYLRVYTEPAFGLGGNDSVTLANAEGVVIDTTTWSGHAPETWGRCPDVTGAFTQTVAATPAMPNNCGTVEVPVADPWPGSQDVTDGLPVGAIGGDLSGLDFDQVDPTLLWGVNNGTGELYSFTPAGSAAPSIDTFRLRYQDGTGTPDAEGVSSAPNGVIYVATERNNDQSGTSRPSVLRFELAPSGGLAETGGALFAAVDRGELLATQEWNLAPIVGTLGANAGLEAVEWVPDATVQALGLVDATTGAPYSPATYGPHGGGVIIVGVEGTGNVHVLVLEDDGGITQLAQFASGFRGVMALDFNAATNQLWVMCDEVCQGQGRVYTVESGVFTEVGYYERPSGMENFANEGFAIGQCLQDEQLVAWGDDNETNGISLRYGTLPCDSATVPVTPSTPGAPPAGQLPATGVDGVTTALVLAALALLAGVGLLGGRRVRRSVAR